MTQGIIYLVGNSILETDRSPHKIQKYLVNRFPKIDFVELDPTEEFLSEGDELILIDTIHGIDAVKKFTDINSFEKPPRNSVHDYDLYWELSLLLKVKKIKKIIIIGLPEEIVDLDKTQDDTVNLISSI